MNDFKYERVERLGRKQLLGDLNSADPDRVCNALYSACRTESDTKWLEDVCLSRMTATDLKVRWAAVTCLGDLAFLRHKLDLTRVIPALKRAVDDPTISDPATVSLSMVNDFSARAGTSEDGPNTTESGTRTT